VNGTAGVEGGVLRREANTAYPPPGADGSVTASSAENLYCFQVIRTNTPKLETLQVYPGTPVSNSRTHYCQGTG